MTFYRPHDWVDPETDKTDLTKLCTHTEINGRLKDKREKCAAFGIDDRVSCLADSDCSWIFDMPLSTTGNTCTHRDTYRTYPEWYNTCKELSQYGCTKYSKNCVWVNGDGCEMKVDRWTT
jgi:hypothetical protein